MVAAVRRCFIFLFTIAVFLKDAALYFLPSHTTVIMPSCSSMQPCITLDGLVTLLSKVYQRVKDNLQSIVYLQEKVTQPVLVSL